jgi:hypothetical protein
MISQNRADDTRQVLPDHQWQFVQTEERQSEELLRLSTQILELTKTIHALTVQAGEATTPPSAREQSNQGTRPGRSPRTKRMWGKTDTRSSVIADA